jgi:hypothetical protein
MHFFCMQHAASFCACVDAAGYVKSLYPLLLCQAPQLTLPELTVLPVHLLVMSSQHPPTVGALPAIGCVGFDLGRLL